MELSNPTPESPNKIKKIIAEQVAGGILDPLEAQKLEQKSIDEAKITYAEQSIYNDPATSEKESEVLAELRKAEKGVFKDLDTKQRLDLIKKSQNRIFQNNQTFKQDTKIAMEANEDDITSRLADPSRGAVTPTEVRRMMNDGKITPEFAKTVVTALESAAEKKADRSATFVKLAGTIINPGEYKDKDIRLQLLKDSAAGNLDQEEFQMLDQFRKLIGEDMVASKMATPKSKSVLGLFSWADANDQLSSIETKARMFKNYMKLINNGVEADEAVKQVKFREAVYLHPGLLTYNEEGQLVVDNKGNIRKVKPSGEITPYDDSD